MTDKSLRFARGLEMGCRLLWCAGAGMVACTATARSSAAQIPPSIEFRVPKAPTVAVGDSGAFLSYELHVTNLSPDSLVLRRVEILDGTSGKTLQSVQDSVLTRNIARPGPRVAPASFAQINGGLRAVVYLWLPIDGKKPPATLRHRIVVQRVGGDSAVSTIEGAQISVAPRAIVIGPPLHGEWLAGNGPSNASGHRRTALGLNGTVAIGQRFAIDFLQVDSSSNSHRRDRSKNENFYAEGNDVLAVADGIVVETKDSIPENDPSSSTNRAVPITLVTVGGNHIVIDIGGGHFAFYAHVKPGSQRVKLGDHVKRGQVIALVGNSGNSTEPHLHFHISDSVASGTSTLGSEGLPYALSSLEIVGRCTLTTSIACTRFAPVTVRNAMPMQNELVRFPK
ncbi:MAG: M23 family metallopeptidase [Gemmatimonadota bacterium]|nr:M23 family metallopeptidase [Gemmatimonadota bacterium]